MAQRERTIFSIVDGTALTALVAEDVVMLEIVREVPAVYPAKGPTLQRTPILVSVEDLTGLARFAAETPAPGPAAELPTDERASAEER